VLRLTKLSLTHRTVVVLLSVLMAGTGVYATWSLKQELLPAMDIGEGSVTSAYPGASPEVVETEVGKPIADAVKGVDGVTKVTSESSSGTSQVSVEWGYGHSTEEMATKIRTAVDTVEASLPDGVEPSVSAGSTEALPIVQLALSSDDSLEDLSQKVTDVVVPELKSVQGVRDVTVAGKEEREIVVTYEQDKLDKYGVDPASISQLFAENSAALPSGTLRTGAANIDVQTGESYSTADEVADLMVQGTDDPVRLGSFASVKEQPVDKLTLSRVEGRDALTVSVTKLSDANTVAVAHEITDKLDDLEKQLGGNAEFVTVFDQSPFIEQSIHDLSVEGSIGLAMAILTILFFLRSIRPTLITAISIPLSLLIAMIALWIGDYTLNLLTLGALTVAIGRVVDDSIVVIENMKRHQDRGESGVGSIIGAVKEVAGAVTSSTLTTVAVFLPIGLVGGQAGAIFRPFAVAVTVALIASLIVSLTVVPVFASWFMRTRPDAVFPVLSEEDEHAQSRLQRAYLPLLNWTLGHRLLTVGIAAAMFAGTLALVPFLKTEYLGSLGDESLEISMELPAGKSLEETDRAAATIEHLLAGDRSVRTYSTTIGGVSSGFSESQADTNEAALTVSLEAGSDPKATATRLRKHIATLGSEVGTVEVSVGAGPGSESGMTVYAEGTDYERLKAASDQVQAAMGRVPGLIAITSDLDADREMLSIRVHDQTAADLGMTRTTISQAIERSVRGEAIGTIAEGDATLDVYLRSREPVKDLEELRGVMIPVTQMMDADAKETASDRVEAWSDRVSDEQEEDEADEYDDQVDDLEETRESSEEEAEQLRISVAEAKEDLAQLRRELARAQASPNSSDPKVTARILRLNNQVSAATDRVEELSNAHGQAEAGSSSADDQLDELEDGRSESLEAQEEQDAISDAQEAASDARAKPVPLRTVADVDTIHAPSTITRVNGVRTATISADVESADLGATTSQVQTAIDKLELPDGVTLRIGGVSEQQSESFTQLGLAMVAAIAVVYLIMVATFSSLLLPLLLLVSIPFAATGALGLSLITDTPVGIASMIGLLMLIGIVVTNAIVLIDLINQKRKAGAGVQEAIRAGASLRLRPIVMTALATIFALIPMSLGLTGGGVFISKPLAIVVIGGLFSSTLLTLVLVPVLYDLLESWRQGNGRRSRSAARVGASGLVQRSS